MHGECRRKLFEVTDPVCMHCGRPLSGSGAEYCDDCLRRLQSPQRGLTFSCIRQGKAVFLYEGAVKRTMYRLKYANRREYASFLSDCACERWGDWIVQRRIEAVVPVPMYGKKERRRGHNQAALFGKEIARRMNLAFLPNAVRRVRDTRPQKELSGTERANNLKNAFQADDFIVQYKRVLLVDDIYTTGSTAEAVAETLRAAGVMETFFLAACIGKGF